MGTRSLPPLLVLVALGCGGGDDGGPDASDISPSCMEATTQSSLEWVQDNVFTPSCANFSVCHMGAAASAEGLNLESGMTMANVVGVQSSQVGLNIVEAGDPDNSYLMIKLGRGEFPAGATETTMPLSNPTLCDEKLDAIARWINSL